MKAHTEGMHVNWVFAQDLVQIIISEVSLYLPLAAAL